MGVYLSCYFVSYCTEFYATDAARGTMRTEKVTNVISMSYTALGHKLRSFRRWKAQFVAVGIVYTLAMQN